MPGLERQFIDWLRNRAPKHPALLLGPGDDMAVVKSGSGRLLMASDMLLDGVHFDSREHSYRQIGWKAVACCLSDCAAMAVRPVAATVSLALPRDLTLPTIQEICEGAFSIAKEFDLAIAGGDTTSWDKPLAIDVAVLAVPYDGIEPVTRSGAKIGDRIYVTGPLGGSRLGRHLAFRPRVVEGRELAGHFGSRLHAMMDISDGLSIDLWRMCQASGVGAQLVEELLEHAIHADANRLAKSGDESALDHALSDGEDFELLLAVDGDVLASPWPLLAVGEITRDGFGWRRKSGTMEALTPRGYEH